MDHSFKTYTSGKAPGNSVYRASSRLLEILHSPSNALVLDRVRSRQESKDPKMATTQLGKVLVASLSTVPKPTIQRYTQWSVSSLSYFSYG